MAENVGLELTESLREQSGLHPNLDVSCHICSMDHSHGVNDAQCQKLARINRSYTFNNKCIGPPTANVYMLDLRWAVSCLHVNAW